MVFKTLYKESCQKTGWLFLPLLCFFSFSVFGLSDSLSKEEHAVKPPSLQDLFGETENRDSFFIEEDGHEDMDVLFTLSNTDQLDKEGQKNKGIREIARKKKKTEKTRLKKGKSYRVPIVKRKKRKRKKRLNLKEVRPPSVSRVYYDQGTDEAELENLYNEEIRHLFRIVQQNKDPDLLLRLGSLYVEKARFITYKIQGDYENRMSEYERGVRKVKPHLNLKTAHIYNKKALKLFEDFIRQYPKHARKDEVLFFLGFTSYQLGQEASGAKYFQQLEKEFPRSIKLYEARFQMAEFYFSKSKWPDAYKYYSLVAKNRRGKFYFLSLYKMAWSSYKMARAKRALKLLGRVISEGKTKANVASEVKGLTFVEEALGDLAFFYSYSGNPPSQAPAFFYSLLGRERAFKELKKLAYNYRDIGDISGVIYLFSHLIEENPTGLAAFEYKFQVVQTLYESSGPTKKIFKHIGEWLRDYGYESYWAKANAEEGDAVAKANRLIEVTLRDYALKHHQTFRQTKSERSKRMALNFYRLYFTSFRQSKFSHEMRFFYGELLFDTGNYKRAAIQYEQLIKKFPSSKYLKPAYMNQLLAMEKLLPSSAQIDKMTWKKGDTPVNFPESIGKFAAVARRYLKKFPKQKNASTVLYRIAAFYYNFNQFDKAAVYFHQLFNTYPASPHISSVGGLLLELYNKNKDYKALEELAVRFASNKNTDPKLIDEAKFILQQLSFTKAQNLALEGKFKESAHLYEKFARAHPFFFSGLSGFFQCWHKL